MNPHLAVERYSAICRSTSTGHHSARYAFASLGGWIWVFVPSGVSAGLRHMSLDTFPDSRDVLQQAMFAVSGYFTDVLGSITIAYCYTAIGRKIILVQKDMRLITRIFQENLQSTELIDQQDVVPSLGQSGQPASHIHWKDIRMAARAFIILLVYITFYLPFLVKVFYELLTGTALNPPIVSGIASLLASFHTLIDPMLVTWMDDRLWRSFVSLSGCGNATDIENEKDNHGTTSSGERGIRDTRPITSLAP
ncbi:hypothetical protein HDU93_004780 [Gonapodya sp. JEL0774]|nr:hypothetical protein HDU93_004780 [Gonapodya sp. JEL0774]